ncbi:MAG: SH3 domain-containing protein [Ahrensia sp.]
MFSKSFLCLLALSASIASVSVSTPSFAQTTGSIDRGPSGLPLPRFVSLKAQNVNMRVGPGKQYAVSWRYTKAGLPLEILQEYDNWRRVRDAEGTIGWVHGSLLSGTRTAVTAPWGKGDDAAETLKLHVEPQGKSNILAYLKPGVMGEISDCDGVWCKMKVQSGPRTLAGFANQAELWGAYPDEKFE